MTPEIVPNPRLKWHIGDNLRWLADNKAADYLPCGMLHGSFLMQVAEGYEHLVAENRRLERAAQAIEAGTAGTTEIGPVHESPVAESDAPKDAPTVSGVRPWLR